MLLMIRYSISPVCKNGRYLYTSSGGTNPGIPLVLMSGTPHCYRVFRTVPALRVTGQHNCTFKFMHPVLRNNSYGIFSFKVTATPLLLICPGHVHPVFIVTDYRTTFTTEAPCSPESRSTQIADASQLLATKFSKVSLTRTPF